MKKTKIALAVAATALMSSQAFATNGMNMDGYGPVSSAMGGTASAYNNGLGGMMNNPATMGMGSKEGSKFQIAVGNLRPDVSSSMTHPMAGPMEADSSADSFIMPGFGYATKKDGFTWGIGVLGQGGMGTEYAADSFLAAGTGEEVMSQVGVGRVVAPFNYDVNDKLNIGASIDFVWAGMDLKMAASAGQVMSMVDMDNTTMNLGAMPAFDVARFDFADDSDFTGEASGTGFGGKLGFTYKLNNDVTVGASYHTKTALSDLTTDNASMSIYDSSGQLMEMTGSIKVKDFEWPATFAMGVSYKHNDKWLVNTDIKRIGWESVMKSFKMDFTADPAFGGGVLAVEMPQNWKDQTVFMMGAQYQATDKLALRGGVNLSSNPVPDSTLNPLFPATITDHITGGFGYKLGQGSGVDFSLSYAPGVTDTGMSGVTTTHSQVTWQAMYTYAWGVKK